MPRGAGALRSRCQFKRPNSIQDGGGGEKTVYAQFYACRGEFRPKRASEPNEAGRNEATVVGTLRIRASAKARELTEDDQVIIDGALYQILPITNPDQRFRFLEMEVERIRAT